jgi:stress response protein YsnF
MRARSADGLAPPARADVTDSPDHDREVIPVVEERAVVVKRKKLTGGLRVRTVVHEDEEVVKEPLVTEEVEVERVPLDRWVEAPVPVRQEGETTIITLLEEVVVVEKRLRATEEVRITKRRTTRQATQQVTLRREETVVERLEIAGQGDDDPD